MQPPGNRPATALAEKTATWVHWLCIALLAAAFALVLAANSLSWDVPGKPGWPEALLLLLATTGVYGIVERTVAQRVREIGIRIAVGARGADIHRLILGFGLRIAATGAAIGILGAFGLSKLIESVVPAMQTDETLIMVASASLLLAAAAAACYLPSRTATSVDPATILRSE